MGGASGRHFALMNYRDGLRGSLKARTTESLYSGTLYCAAVGASIFFVRA
jgi:hypothetical protein